MFGRISTRAEEFRVELWQAEMAPSKVWNHFSKPYKMPDGQTKVNCNVCNESLTYRNTTTNLRKHAEGKHKLEIPSQAPRGGKKRRTFSAASGASTDKDKESADSEIDSPPASTSAQVSYFGRNVVYCDVFKPKLALARLGAVHLHVAVFRLGWGDIFFLISER